MALLAICAGCAASTTVAQAAQRYESGITAEGRIETGEYLTAATQPVALAEILAYANEHAPDVKVALAEMRRVEAAKAAARPLFPENPELSGSYGQRRGDEGTGTDYGVELSQRFEIAGNRGLRWDVADALADVLQAQVSTTRWDTHALVHALYYQAVLGERRVALAEEVLEFARRLREVSSRRYGAGELPLLEHRIAALEFDQAQQRLVEVQSLYESTLRDLAIASGWQGETLPVPTDGMETEGEIPSADKLTELALRQHPALALAASQAQLSEEELELASREAWPEPTIGVAAEREGELGAPVNVYKVMLGIPIPLWQRNQAARAEAKAELLINRTRLRNFRQTLPQEVRRTTHRVNALYRRILNYRREILPTYADNLELLTRAYEMGEVELTTLIVSQERYLDQRTQYLQALDDYFASVSELERLVGTDLTEAFR